MKLYSPATVRQVIDKYKFTFKKNLGQNFLVDGNIVNKIADAASLGSEDAVLEIGAGIGTLTCALAERAGKVVVIEIDKNLQPVLAETLSGYTNIDMFWGNALKTDFDALVEEKTQGQYGKNGRPFKVVANLPYYITTPLLMHALEKRFNISLMILMVQKEVAERITAAPGSKDYGALTLGVNYYSEPQQVVKVPRKVFMPQPDVESAVIRFIPRKNPPASVENEQAFFLVVKAAFGQRRKTLLNSLSSLGIDKNQIGTILPDLGIDPGRRGETLSFEEFARVSNSLHPLIPEK
ncbi:16S rRNA (adenine(1518)-N(6)/adenine(1519)-N(6))-dimethyltransferase RsmA [Phosphitispora fastidiosa]|uniref:16S rRNA (adenine(1518)-N(6)/adenine(1519)-N(6))- dimethyltransferase RsmA n=1 Tax=Phosphitispora fastidiosa TaxID=2837202 RepID=UPI001E403480|nr:16S rRNA (adenine(1518)-N(6)/adenine(1519)-N(6))-dimethyltransferase RsmA [Phosphitispora fastidiosa]MBU7007756.1 16S rRNA (adenine1518-N6/adenine1519-N6)-dimethyltransferase [Phosphitispora fastidiosa]